MKTFLKQNWFKISILALIVLLGAFFIVRIFSEDKESISGGPSSDKVVSCSEKSQSVLTEEKSNHVSDEALVSQQNHYNGKLNKCLVKINVIVVNNTGSFINVDLKDAYEGKSYITCMFWSTSKEEVHNCTLLPSVSDTREVQKTTWEHGIALMESYLKN